MKMYTLSHQETVDSFDLFTSGDEQQEDLSPEEYQVEVELEDVEGELLEVLPEAEPVEDNASDEEWESFKDKLTAKQREAVSQWVKNNPQILVQKEFASLETTEGRFRFRRMGEGMVTPNLQTFRPSLSPWEKKRFLSSLRRYLLIKQDSPSSEREKRALNRGEIGTLLGLSQRFVDVMDPSLVEEEVISKHLLHPEFVAKIKKQATNS